MNKCFLIFFLAFIGLMQKTSYAQEDHTNNILKERLRNAEVKKTLSQGIENIEVKFPGSLEPNFDVACISMKEVSSQFNPPALILAVKKCVLQNDYEKAWDLLNTSTGFGYYDLQRLADRSTKEALTVLIFRVLGNLTPEQHNKGQQISKIMNADAKRVQAYCAELKRIGPPTYEPQWAIAHGLGVYDDEARQGHYLTNVDPKIIWAEVLRQRCTATQ